MEETQPKEIPMQESDSNAAGIVEQQSRRSHATLVLAILVTVVVGLAVFAEIGTKPIRAQQSNISIDPNFAKIAGMQNWSANPFVYAPLLLPFSKANFTFAEFENLNVTKFAGNLGSLNSLNASWNSVNPRIRCIVLSTLQSMDAYYVLKQNASSIPLIDKAINATNAGNASPCLNSGFAASLSKYYLVPRNATNKISLYEFDFTSALIIGFAKILSAYAQLSQLETSCQKQPQTSASIATYLPYLPRFTNTLGIPTEYSDEFPIIGAAISYSDTFFYLPLDNMLNLLPSRTNTFLELLKGGNTTCGNSSIVKDLFSAYSFYQYAALQNHETLYNVPPPFPTITFAMYFNNTLLLNLGDVNPAASGIRLYVDNKEINYTRYYSFLVANITLYPGNHTISVYGSGLNLSKKLYFEPPIVFNNAYSANRTLVSFTNAGRKPIQIYRIDLLNANFTLNTHNETILPNQTLNYTLPPICNFSFQSIVPLINVSTSEGPVRTYSLLRCS
ncbi:MAG: hypothetical protein ACP5MC_00790 [Candidatus Micrarchaeia archaeon]